MPFLKKKVSNINIIKSERKASRHINITGHFDEKTLIDKDNRLIKIFELTGIDSFTKSSLDLDILKSRRNSLFKTIDSSYAIYTWTIRNKADELPQGEFNQHFAKNLNEKYKKSLIDSNLFQNRIYLALISKAPEGKINKTFNFIKKLSHCYNQKLKEDYLKKTHANMIQMTSRFLNVFKYYGIRELGLIKKQFNDDPYYLSEPLEIVAELLNAKKTTVRLMQTDADKTVLKNRPFFNARLGLIEFRYFDHAKKFGAVISLKDYTNGTHAGLLDSIDKLPIEMIITQSYRFFDAHTSKKALKNQQKDFAQISDESKSQTAQLSNSLDEAASGEAGFGLHHLSIMCLSDTQQNLNQHVGNIIAKFSDMDISCVREDISVELGFWAQLPGNFSYIFREAPISTKNLSGFVSFDNDAVGKKNNNHWGEALTILETISGGEYFFNHHYKEVGNTLIFGSMGSGKTLLKGFLITQSLKFGGKRVIFDKDRGLEILVRALGGKYEILKPGIPTNFNPCKLKETQANKNFLNQLFKKMLTIHGQSFDEYEAEIINKVVERIFMLPESQRQLQHIAPYFGVKTKGSLRARFDEWHSTGSKAWLFDNEKDDLDLNPDILGFELGSLLSDLECKTPALMYLFHQIDEAMKGQRGAIYIDEGWIAMQDKELCKKIDDESRTPRKKNKFLCLATQSADDAANSTVNDILYASASCKIFFANPAAKRETYIEKLGLTEREFHLIKNLDETGNYFLLNFGHGKESVVLRLPLKNMEDEIAVISGRESTVKLLDKIREKVGDNPKEWMPIFLKWYKKAEQYV